MAVEIWPRLAHDELKRAVEVSEKRELDWLIEALHETLTDLKHGLEHCYSLLAPIDPGSTLAVSTPRNEVVKGYVTRVGTRIVKGTIHVRLRTLPPQTLTIDPDHPIHLAPLTSLHTFLTQAIDLLGITLSYSYPTAHPPPRTTTTSSAQFLAAQLRLLSQSLLEASSLLKGPPLTTSDPTWTSRSIAPSHFLPPPNPTHPSPLAHAANGVPPLSFHLGIQDSCLVLWLRSLEPADAPVNFGTKLALAIGTTRRLEHDEAEKTFGFCCSHDASPAPTDDGRGGGPVTRHASFPAGDVPLSGRRPVDVFVREKVRIETADPSLLSLSSKLAALGRTLAAARRNLAAVMGEEEDREGEDA
ncbi:RAVE subunit 2/Rogdi [Schizothecium vesticola]|uniref:RAVE subunit 2/Rogdi n=1 Tax=Schizothecium vesticola TaxID=314040 RepID=A0AA40F0S1_9PEZI|nr:RAVE subunit 2/Rogdi [Schizothecium vesticola]